MLSKGRIVCGVGWGGVGGVAGGRWLCYEEVLKKDHSPADASSVMAF